MASTCSLTFGAVSCAQNIPSAADIRRSDQSVTATAAAVAVAVAAATAAGCNLRPTQRPVASGLLALMLTYPSSLYQLVSSAEPNQGLQSPV